MSPSTEHSRLDPRRWPVPIRENLPLIAVALVWSASWALASWALDLPRVTNEGIGTHLAELGGYFVTDLLPLLALFLPVVHFLGGGSLSDLLELSFWKERAARYLTARVVVGFLIVMAALPLLYAAYRDWKTAIPAFVPFYLDPVLERADRLLHGGRHPWEWLQPVVGGEAGTRLIDGLYVFWFEAKLAVVLWMGFSARRFVRARFFLTYAALYVLLGQLAATAFSSAGPAYFSRVTELGGADPYAPLMGYLAGIEESGYLFALDMQRGLWGGYTGAHDGPISGISAFPSIHVAAATLYVFMGFQVHRAVGWGFVLLLAATLVGSVHLGWHYALDGYASMLAVAGLWALSGPAARAWFRWAGLDASGDPSAPEELRGPAHTEATAPGAYASMP